MRLSEIKPVRWDKEKLIKNKGIVSRKIQERGVLEAKESIKDQIEKAAIIDGGNIDEYFVRSANIDKLGYSSKQTFGRSPDIGDDDFSIDYIGNSKGKPALWFYPLSYYLKNSGEAYATDMPHVWLVRIKPNAWLQPVNNDRAVKRDAPEGKERVGILRKSAVPAAIFFKPAFDVVDKFYDYGSQHKKHGVVKDVAEGLIIDVPNENWLQGKIDYAKSKGRDSYGVPYMNATTAYVKPDVHIPVDILKRLPGMRGEQKNVRHGDLKAIMDIMRDTGKLPLGRDGTEYAPFVLVAHNGEAWVSEGNHRIMAAAALGWDTLPVELKYFDGGERVKSGPLYPEKIGLGKQGVAEDTVDEMALSTYKTMGDFSKPGPFTGADKKLVPHPKNIEKATRFFEQTPFDFRLFFSHLKGTGKYSEHGPMSPDEIRKVFGQDAEEIINGSEDAITVVYVGNKGDAKVMLTPWMMAHRFGHAVNRGAYRAGSVGAWKEAEKHFFNSVNGLLNDYYGKLGKSSSDVKYELTPEYNALFNAIGTQRSSRNNEIRRPYEFFYELFAQYLGTGQITLNPFPTNLGYGRKVWGNPTKYLNIKPEYRDETERKYAAEMLARDMEIMFNDVLSDSVGKIFVM